MIKLRIILILILIIILGSIFWAQNIYIDIVAEAPGKIIPSDNVKFINKTGTDPRNYRVNFSKLKSILGFKCKISVEDGIKEIIDHLEEFKEDKYDAVDNFGNYKIKI